MNLDEAKEKFISSWGVLGSNWGINKTMAQIHALLLITPEALSTEEIMDTLQISRGNANMNIRALIDWKLVHKEHKRGERKEFFGAEKDIWTVSMHIMRERRKKELAPLLETLSQFDQVVLENNEESKAFKEVTTDIQEFSEKVDVLLERFNKADQSWFTKQLIKLIT